MPPPAWHRARPRRCGPAARREAAGRARQQWPLGPMRSVATRSKKPTSAKTSTNSARPSAATAGIMSSATFAAYSPSVTPSGTAWAPRKVVTTRSGSRSATRADDPQVAELLVERQPVARLALDSGRARGQGGAQTRLDEGFERRVLGGAGGGDGAQDAAPGVRSTPEPGGCLVRSVAGEDGVGVAVDEARGDERRSEVDAIVIVRGLRCGSDPGDPAVTHLDRPRRDPGWARGARRRSGASAYQTGLLVSRR